MQQPPHPIAEAGAITYRMVDGRPEVLLIYSRKQPRVRIYPKGHIEAGESAGEAAGRELLEEAGVCGHLVRELGCVTYEFRGKQFQVDYFLFEFIEQATRGEDGREPSWFTPDDAMRLLPFDGLREVLQRALCNLS